MKTSEAIRILSPEATPIKTRRKNQFQEAVSLGIEALKSHQRALEGFLYPEQFLLRGETLEDRDETAESH